MVATGQAYLTSLTKAGQGRHPLGLVKMLRIYFLQQRFNLSDPQAEDAIYDSESMRRFVRIELGEEVMPDASTILRFRHLLEQHGLTEAIFNSITGLLEERRLLLRSGTIADATCWMNRPPVLTNRCCKLVNDQHRQRQPPPGVPEVISSQAQPQPDLVGAKAVAAKPRPARPPACFL
jgi:hypothetical protein